MTWVMLASILLTACAGYKRERDEAGQVTNPGQTTEQVQNNTGAATGESTPAGTKLKIGETGLLGGAKITVTNVETRFSPLGEGRVLVLTDMIIENPTDSSFAVASLSWFQLTDPDGTSVRINGVAHGGLPVAIDGSVGQGETKEGAAGFDIGQKEGEYTLRILRPGVPDPLEFVFELPPPAE